MHGIESLKTRIRNGDRVVGASVRMWATQSDVDRTLSFADYDFLAVDAQHSPFSEENLVNICEIANGMGVPIQLRIKHTRLTFLIGNMLDLGPTLIEVPQVENLGTVQDALDNFYYPQRGRRSFASIKGFNKMTIWHFSCRMLYRKATHFNARQGSRVCVELFSIKKAV